MARQDLGHAGDMSLELQRRFAGMIPQGDLDEGHNAIAKLLTTQPGLVALNEPIGLKTLEPSPAGGFTQRKLLGQFGV